MERLLPEYQSQPWTTELSKAIGHAVASVPGLKLSAAASPVVIENTIRAWTGGLGVHLLNMADASLQAAGVLPERSDPAKKLSDIPFIKGFVVRYPTAGAESIETFFERYELEKRTLETVRFLAKNGDADAARRERAIQGGIVVDPRGYQRTLSGISELIRRVWRNPAIPPEEKRQKIDRLYFRMIDVAREGNAMLDRVEATRERRRERQ